MTMTIKPSTLKDYIDELDDLPASILLGRIVMFTISDEPVDRADVVRWFQELSLNPSMLPPEIRLVDAFKKATSEAKGSYPLAGERTAYTLCREVSSTPDYVRRQITREIKDSKRKSLSYDAAIECTFYRAQNGNPLSARLDLRAQWGQLSFEEHDEIKILLKEIESSYVRHATKLDGNKLRAVVRDYLKQCLNAIELRAGVYFVHANRDVELANLSTLVDRFGGDCRMNMVPIVNLARERAFVAERFEREAAESLRDITAEARELIASGRVTPASYKKLKTQFDSMINKASEHMATLGLAQDITAASADVAEDALADVMQLMLASE